MITDAPKILEHGHALHILLVENNQNNRLLGQSYLKNATYHVDVAGNGEIAVEKFTSLHYDLVLMDVQMPVLNDYSSTRTIRIWQQEQRVGPIPIITLTAYALVEDTQKSVAAECTSHVTKPVKKAALIEAVQEHTREIAV